MQILTWTMRRLFLIAMWALVMTLLLLPTTTKAQTPTATPLAPAEGTPPPESTDSKVGEAVESVAERTPIPTPTPGIVQREVTDLTEALGVEDVTFLGLTSADWINLGLSVLIFALSYWAAVWFVSHFLRRLVRRTQTGFDDQFFAVIAQDVKLLLGILILRFSVLRLTFIAGALRTLLDDIFFILTLVVLMRIAVKLISFGINWYKSTYLDPQKRSVVDPALLMLNNAGKLLVYVTGVSIALSHFGIISNAVVIVLLAVGFVVLLSIRDIMTDLIYGFIILVSQPFRVGDAIHVESMEEGDWGWVAAIDSRETHIRTRDNRMLVIPNASLGSDQVINYMSPDPTFRVQSDLHFAYETDFDQIQPLLEATARGVEGVLTDKPVEVLYWRFGKFGYTARVRWWIASCEQDHEMMTRVNGALVAAMTAAGVKMGYTAVDLHAE